MASINVSVNVDAASFQKELEAIEARLLASAAEPVLPVGYMCGTCGREDGGHEDTCLHWRPQ